VKIFKHISKWFNEYEIRRCSNDSFHVKLWRKQLEKDALEIGKEIEIWFGGSFSPITIHKFIYLGTYKDKKVFKEL